MSDALSYGHYAGVYTFTSAGAVADREVLYLGILAHFRTYTAMPPVPYRIWGEASLTSLWDQTEVVLGGSTYGHVYRPSLSLFCDKVFGHPSELVFGEGTPQAFCFVHPDIHALPGADIPVVGSAALRQGVQIVAHGLDFSALARCLVRGWETVAGYSASANSTVRCNLHTLSHIDPPADWTPPGCISGELPDPANAVRNYVF